MSTWIYITNLPNYYDEYGLIELFDDIGQIKRCYIKKDNLLMKSQGFVQFNNEKHCKLGASKKDQTVIANNAIRVFIVWNSKENLSTVRISNIESSISTQELQDLFNPYGEIVDIRITNKNNNVNAFVSFIRVDYALQASQEMNGTIIFGSESTLKVELCNPDARNLKWKRNSFQYILTKIPNRDQMKLITNHNYNKYKYKNNKNNRKYYFGYYNDQKNGNNDSFVTNSSLNASYYHKNRNKKYNKNISHSPLSSSNSLISKNYHNNSQFAIPLNYITGNSNSRNSGYRTYNVPDSKLNKNQNIFTSNLLTHGHSINSTSSSGTSTISASNSSQSLTTIAHENIQQNPIGFKNYCNSISPTHISPLQSISMKQNNLVTTLTNSNSYGVLSPYSNIGSPKNIGSPINVGSLNSIVSPSILTSNIVSPSILTPNILSPNSAQNVGSVMSFPVTKNVNDKNEDFINLTKNSNNSDNNNQVEVNQIKSPIISINNTEPNNPTSPSLSQYFNHVLSPKMNNNKCLPSNHIFTKQPNFGIADLSTLTNSNSKRPMTINVTPPIQISQQKYFYPTQIQMNQNLFNKNRNNENNDNNQKQNVNSKSSSNSDLKKFNESKHLLSLNSCDKRNIPRSHWTKIQQLLGDNLYAIIEKKYPERVGKIVGMILKDTISNIKYLLNNHQALDLKSEQLNRILTIHENQNQKQKQNQK